MALTKVALFIGTRPEAIKMAPVFHALEKSSDFAPVVVSSGQHREMLDQVVELFNIRIDVDLAVMRSNQGLAGLSARLIEGIDAFLENDRPDMALVQGDTTTVFCAALCCFYRNLPVGHVEAGLRTGNLRSPFPEECNRVLAGRLASIHFPPTETSRDNLLREHIPAEDIFVTGNTVIDALLLERKRQQNEQTKSLIDNRLSEQLGSRWRQQQTILITGHRRENFGDGFLQICQAIKELAQRFPDHHFVYPVHLNPNVQQPVNSLLAQHANIQLIKPLPYSEFIALMDHAQIILTDSGGVQEEAPSLGKPVLVMRDTTERPEGVAAGTVRLVGAQSQRIVDEATLLLSDKVAYKKMAEAINPYGDGTAAERILNGLRSYQNR